MVKLRIVRFPRVRHVYASQSRPVPEQLTDYQLIEVSPNQVDEQPVVQTDAKPVVVIQNDAEVKRKTKADKQDVLLLKEMDEANKWARLGAQLYFGWYTLILTINGLATGWLFTNRGVMPRFARLMFLIIVGLNLMGTIVTILISKHMLESDQRIQNVLAGLTKDEASGDQFFAPQSPMPRQTIMVVFPFTGASLFMFLLFWIILALWPETLLG